MRETPMIHLICQSCRKRCNAPEGAVGKLAKCPNCGSHFEVTNAAALPTGLAIALDDQIANPQRVPRVREVAPNANVAIPVARPLSPASSSGNSADPAP